MLTRFFLFGLALPLLVFCDLASAQDVVPSKQGECATARAALMRGELSKARDAYLDVLAEDPSSPCANSGLNLVTATTRTEERFCAEGKALGTGKQEEESRQRYVEALGLNVNSECAAKGLAPPEDKGKKEVEEWADLIPKVLLAVGSVLLAGLLVLAVLYLIAATVTRLRRRSLRIEPFADGGVEPKVGAALAAMVETRLHQLSGRRGQPESGYQLDFIVADVELFAADDDLASTMKAFAEVPQLSLLVALLSSLDRIAGRRTYVASGELAPAGEAGTGVALAVRRRNRLQARRTFWAPAPIAAAPAADAVEHPSPTGFYGLVVPAAAWLQYEVAAGLRPEIRLLTGDAESWSRLGVALARQREGNVTKAIEAYAEAIELDPDNVGALVNLSLLAARRFGLYADAIVLLLHARKVLLQRYGDQA